MKPWLLLTLGLTGMAALTAAPITASLPWDLSHLQQPPQMEWIGKEAAHRSLKFRGLRYQERETEVFAYYGVPAQAPREGHRFPAMVLVHGGGGRAFPQWVTHWTDQGYAAIAMDLAGRGPGGARLPKGGPDQTHAQKFGTIGAPISDQWSYHAVANVILAHSLLRSFDEIDRQRTGLTGISWGGYLTCIVAGLDSRFQFAMPVYGCGFLRDNSTWKGTEFNKMTPAQSDRWHRLWDPSQYLPHVKIPMVFLNGTNDFAYPMDSYARSCNLVPSHRYYSIQLNMRHGHIFDFPEFSYFADHFLKSASPPLEVMTPEREGNQITTWVRGDASIRSAHLHYTTGPHKDNRTRGWMSVPLQIHSNRLQGPAPPPTATAWYVEVRDGRNALTSSQVCLPESAEVSP